MRAMTVRRHIAAFLGAVLVLFAIVAGAQAQQGFTFPAFTNYVVDEAGVLSPGDEAALVAKLKAFQDRTGRQIAVATVRSLQGTSVEDYGNRLFREWKLGDKETNDGALILVAPTERKVRIEVGYGLEGDLTDAVSRLIIENAILPRFKSGDFAGGIGRGADDVIAVISGDAEDFKKRAAAGEEEDLLSTVIMIAFLLFFLWVMWRSIRSSGSGLRRSRHGPWIIGGPGSGGGWSGGGGGWSGGGGGFGGGGGGSSGGGGASGSW